MKLPRHWNLISAAIAIVFLTFALTFGMSEWKDNSMTATAPAPAKSSVH